MVGANRNTSLCHFFSWFSLVKRFGIPCQSSTIHPKERWHFEMFNRNGDGPYSLCSIRDHPLNRTLGNHDALVPSIYFANTACAYSVTSKRGSTWVFNMQHVALFYTRFRLSWCTYLKIFAFFADSNILQLDSFSLDSAHKQQVPINTQVSCSWDDHLNQKGFIHGSC